MKVTQYMTQKVISAKPDDGIRSAFFTMKREDIRHMPVVDDNGRLIGIISDRDLRRPDWVDEAPDLSHVYNLEDHITVKDLMTTNPVVVYTYDKIGKANKLMLQHNFGAMPVLNKDETLAGMLSAVDLLKAFDDLLNEGRKDRKKGNKS